ncbi:Dockerin type I repeat protein [Rubripirellula reticaptiva]|uniref:Dockerin type I repeat protein n=2 Tax=Rubripirellula reticaptiva TaxID=2528013 RepID=A0A5C6EBN7_9BACT|nr:Dockerin type I repeat protein [Rubripirellula reticaptiva]
MGDVATYRRTLDLDGEVTYSPLSSLAKIDASTIANDLDAGHRVVVDTTIDTESVSGNITIGSAIVKRTAGPAGLTFQADNDIVVLSSIRSTGSSDAALELTFNSDRDNVDGGRVLIDAAASLSTLGGSVTIGGGTDPLTIPASGNAGAPDGVVIDGSISTGTGQVSVLGVGTTVLPLDSAASSASGVVIGGVIRTTSGSVLIVGSAGDAQNDSDGVRFTGQVISQSGFVAVDGTVSGIGTAVSSNNNGVELRGGTITSAGNIDVFGNVEGSTLSGTGNHGVLLHSAARVVSIASANVDTAIKIQGRVNAPQASDSDGVHVTGVGSEILSDVANIAITGSSVGGGRNTGNDGVELFASTLVTSIGFAGRSGEVSLTGSSDGGRGVRISNNVTIASLGDSRSAAIKILGTLESLPTDDRVAVEAGGDLDAKSVSIISSDSVVVNDTAVITSDEVSISLGSTGRIANSISIDLESIASSSGSFTIEGKGSLDRLQLSSEFLSRATTDVTGATMASLVADGRRIDLLNVGMIDLLADVAHSSVILGNQLSETVTVETNVNDNSILVSTNAGFAVQTRPQRTFTLNTGLGDDFVDVTSFRTSLTTSASFQDGDAVANDQWTLSGDFTSTTGTTSLNVDAANVRVFADVDSVAANVVLGRSQSSSLIELDQTQIIAGQINFVAPVQIQNNAEIQSLASSIDFAETVIGPGNLLIDSAGSIRFSAGVGGSVPIGSLDAQAVDEVLLLESVISNGDLRFRTPVQSVGLLPSQFTSLRGAVAFDSTLDAADGRLISIDSSLPTRLLGEVGGRSALGGLVVISGGPLRIGTSLQIDGNVDLEVRDSVEGNDLIVVSDGASIQASGSVRISAGDEIVIQSVATIAADSVTLDVDSSPISANDPGGTVSVLGRTESRSGPIIISGGNDDDDFIIDLATQRTTRDFHVLGGNEVSAGRGDRIAFSGAKSVSPQSISMTLTEQSQGSIRLSDGPSISFDDVELVETDQASELVLNFDAISNLDFTVRDHNQAGLNEVVGSNGLQTRIVFANPTEQMKILLSDGNDKATIEKLDNAFAVPTFIDGNDGSDELWVQDASFANINGRALDLAELENVSIQDSDFAGNQAVSGAAIRLQGGVIDVARSTFSQNTAIRRGGAIEVVDGRVSIRDSLFRGNASGDNGGALFAMSSTGLSDAVEVASTIFEQNQSDASGGAIMLQNLDASFDDVTFIGNIATGNAWQISKGGGLAIVGSETFEPVVELLNVTLDQNSAETGGGVSVVDARLQLVRSIVTANRASSIVYGGGGIEVTATRSTSSASLSVTDSEIKNNVAIGEGGGVMLVGVGATINESSIESNSAENGVGGGISAYTNGITGDLLITDSMIIGNRAGKSGGGVAIVGIGVDWNRVTVTGNQARTFAGGLDFINHDSQTSRSIAESSITNNTALAGEADIAQTGLPLQITVSTAGESEFIYDVNRDGAVTSMDALLVVNRIAKIVATGEQTSANSITRLATDVNADGETTALDALMIINQLARQTLVQMNSGLRAISTDVDGDDEVGGESRLF